jgi:hypothetical protein
MTTAKDAAKLRIDMASAATATSERAIESVTNLLKTERPVNAMGVYMDRRAVEADLMAAWRDIRGAIDALRDTPWPLPGDYNEV